MSDTFILENTATAQWHSLLRQAEEKNHCQLEEDMESYLVFTLMRFTRDQNFARNALANYYLTAQQHTGRLRDDQLRDVGDQCLILSGLFPKQAERRLVKVNYYVELGRSAYHHLSHTLQYAGAELYENLYETFVVLMELLHTIRGFTSPALTPVQEYELVSENMKTQSRFNQKTVIPEIFLDKNINH